MLESGEPITDTAPIIYTAKEDGVLPAYNIRTDRFDIAMDAYDKITRNSAKKEIAPKPEDFGNVPNKQREDHQVKTKLFEKVFSKPCR